MIYQTLVGVWPGAVSADLVNRVQAYAIKAAREGKQETSWTAPDEAYETALTSFVTRLLDPQISAGFLASFEIFAQRTTLLGALISLSQLALKATLPGVPDFYQGSEFWDLSLVDPDNRRPVDFPRRSEFLRANETDWAKLASGWRSGEIKFELTRRLLRLRREWPNLFQQGNYEPLAAAGAHGGHVIAFSRTWKNQRVVIAVGRQFGPVTNGGRHWPLPWDATLKLPDGTYEQVFTADGNSCTGAVEVSHLFTSLPVSVLLRS